MNTWQVGAAALNPGELLLTLVAAGVGSSVAQACGCGTDVVGGLAMMLLAVLAQVANQWHRWLHESVHKPLRAGGAATAPHGACSDGPADAGTPSATQALRDALHGLLIVIAGALVLLAARSGPGPLLVGLAGLGLGWLRTLSGARPRWGPLGAALGTWLVVVGADAVQRQRFSDMAALAATSLALLSFSAAWLAATAPSDPMLPAAQRSGRAAAGPLLVALAALAWVAAWWFVQWLPATAWWALGSAPLSVAAALAPGGSASPPGRGGWAHRWALAAAIAHGLLQVAALLAVASLR